MAECSLQQATLPTRDLLQLTKGWPCGMEAPGNRWTQDGAMDRMTRRRTSGCSKVTSLQAESDRAGPWHTSSPSGTAPPGSRWGLSSMVFHFAFSNSTVPCTSADNSPARKMARLSTTSPSGHRRLKSSLIPRPNCEPLCGICLVPAGFATAIGLISMKSSIRRRNRDLSRERQIRRSQ